MLEREQLMHAPPRLSDLRGDELTEALTQRHESHRRAWLASRSRRSLIERAAEWIRDRLEGARA